MLDTLVDAVGEDETHPLTLLMDAVGVLTRQYDDHVPESSPTDMEHMTKAE